MYICDWILFLAILSLLLFFIPPVPSLLPLCHFLFSSHVFSSTILSLPPLRSHVPLPSLWPTRTFMSTHKYLTMFSIWVETWSILSFYLFCLMGRLQGFKSPGQAQCLSSGLSGLSLSPSLPRIPCLVPMDQDVKISATNRQHVCLLPALWNCSDWLSISPSPPLSLVYSSSWPATHR